jgi:hypothetical protein
MQATDFSDDRIWTSTKAGRTINKLWNYVEDDISVEISNYVLPFEWIPEEQIWQRILITQRLSY